MVDNLENAVFEILKKIQADLAALRTSLDRRFDNFEETLHSERRDTTGAFILTQTMFRDLNTSVNDLEHRIERLEDDRSA